MSQPERGQVLLESIVEVGTNAFNPAAPESIRPTRIAEFDDLIERTKTLNLLAALNKLIRPGAVPPWLRPKIMEKLTCVPLRPDGVRGTLEFVVSVHPSSTVKASEAAVPQKKGANITQEALELASKVLSNPPKSVTPETWYSTISAQLLQLLDGNEGPDLTKAASYVIGFGILGRQISGAPGTPGYRFFAMPLLGPIQPPPGLDFDKDADTEPGDGIVYAGRYRVLVPYDDLVTALRRLHSLLLLHPNPNLCKRLLSPIILGLWALASWSEPQPHAAEKVCKPALELLKVYLKVAPAPDRILQLIHNLGYRGGYDKNTPEWTYKGTETGLIRIVDARQRAGDLSVSASGLTLGNIDQKASKLLDIVSSSLSDADISTAFLELLKRWLKSARGSKRGEIVVKEAEEKDPIVQLHEMKTLQAMLERFPEKLATQPTHLIDLVSQILAGLGDALDGNEEVIGIALSLLNVVITAPGFRRSGVDPNVLSLIESSLDKLSKAPNDLSQTASNLRLLLVYRDELDPSSSTTSAPTDQQIEDRKTYSLAISYITEAEAPPPIRAEGLNLISTLITSNSPILDIPGILVLLSSLMSDSDEFIYLRIIKLYTLLCNRHPQSVVRELTDHFLDAKETHPLDARLRFGEALLQVIQRLGETFTASLAQETGTALVAVAGRRGRRPKTEARQRREARAQEKRNREAAEAWGGELPDMSDDHDVPEEERMRNEALERIVEGWESKRGSEDVRVRASALSVLGAAVEVNLVGLGKEIVTGAVDLCLSVLQLEREVEKGILRRAAVVFVLSFVRALEEARENGRDLGFGFGKTAQEDVMRTLRYVAETDNDGLVVQHARDAVESLENWQLIRLLPAASERSQAALRGGLMKLAGLEIDPERSLAGRESSTPKPKPKIEEVE
ncbi:hypothetical protein N657DRAFT_694730 [Parathielavia appendiculata]|uniref:Uncharacterized protein n=1 Tax=Parathielavia appendiculata TaxID=2587402 RepID=A0AAN6TNY3_9PEZI|nr:hypothetical protein N657DRAFT_694730 [Parathielavia appendiculata]